MVDADYELSEGADAVQRGLHQRRRDPPAARLRPEARVAHDKRRVAERKAAQEQDELDHGGALQLGGVREHPREGLHWAAASAVLAMRPRCYYGFRLDDNRYQVFSRRSLPVD